MRDPRLKSYDAVKARPKPKAKKGLKPVSAKTGGHRFPDNVDEGLRDFVRHLPCLVRRHAEHPVCVYTEKKDKATGEPFFGCDAAHIVPAARGVPDAEHLVPLCRRAHQEQEGKNKEFEYKYQISLKREARKVTSAYLDSLSGKVRGE